MRPAFRMLGGVVALAVALGATGCATYSDRTQSARDALDAGDLNGGLVEINRYMKVPKGKPTGEPKKWKKDTALAVLERATILHAQGAFEESARDFGVADKQLELLDLASGANQIGKWIYSDSATKYKIPPTERLALSGINLLNYLCLGDLNGARVEAKRFTVSKNYLDDYKPKAAHGAFGSYLAGFTFEQLGEYESALRYYDEALQAGDLPSLRDPISRIAEKSSFRGERLAEYVGQAPADEPGADVLIVVNVGRVPHKIPKRIPIGAAVGLAHGYFTGDPTVLEYSAFKVVTYPELADYPPIFDSASLKVDGSRVPMDLTTDLARDIRNEYDALIPQIIGAAITRMITRAIAAEAARAGGNAAGSSGDNREASEREATGQLVGLLAALAVEGSMVALDKPDTRSWTTLPAKVFIARRHLSPGTHTLEIWATGDGGEEMRTVTVEVPEAGFVVVDVTTLR